METKTCTKCKRELTFDKFRLKNRQLYNSRCVYCVAENHRKFEEDRKQRSECRCGNTITDEKTLCTVCLKSGVEHKRAYYHANKEKVKYGIKLSVHRAKVRAMLKLGGLVCRGCGETDYRTLTIDHAEGCGAKQRLGNDVLRQQILQDKVDVTKFRVLCANCQARHEYKRNKRFMYPEILDFVLAHGGKVPPMERFKI